MNGSEHAERAATVLGLAALTAVLGLRDGGTDAGGTAVAAVAVGGLILVRLAVARDPLAGLSRGGMVGAGALVALALLAAASALWSGSSSRALLEFDRTLLYALVFAACATVADGERTLRALTPALAGALALVATAAWSARAAPGLFDVADARASARLAWPVGDPNVLGLVAVIGLLLAAAVVADRSRGPTLRAAFAAPLPILAVTGYLTLSRGAVLALVLGLGCLAFGRGRAALAPLGAAFGAAAIAVVSAYRAQGLVAVPPADGSGRPVVVAVVLCTLAAAGLAFMLARATRAREPAAPPAPARRWALKGAAVAVICVAGVTLGAPGALRDAYDEARAPGLVDTGADVRNRLTDLSSNGRRELWEIAVDAFADEPLLGTGAGTYAVARYRERTLDRPEEDAHSLYLEFAAERGLAGLALLLFALAPGVTALVRRGRTVEAVALSAAVLTWLVHAGIDRDWEHPVASLWLFAVLGAATARSAAPAEPARRGLALRVIGGLAIAVLLFVPFQTGRSQAALTDAQAALERGDCSTVLDRAPAAADIASWRAAPYELLAVCAARGGDFAAARGFAAAAVHRDQDGWTSLWVRAVVDAAAGAGSVEGFRKARRANPLNGTIDSATTVARFTPPARLRELATGLPLELEGAPDTTIDGR